MSPTPPDPWAALARLTAARIALGRAGGSLPTGAHLAFQLAHAQARDAVHHPADLPGVAAQLAQAGLGSIAVSSAAGDRLTYLRRPDLGRRLASGERARLEHPASDGGVDAAIVIADGLSGFAVERQAAPLAAQVTRHLTAAGWRFAPAVLVSQGRVAIGDEIGALLGAHLVVVLVGERPGLSSPDSLGAYITLGPGPGRTDADRNCVSNIRPGGLELGAAAAKIIWLLTEARRRGVTGVSLKEELGRVLPGTGR